MEECTDLSISLTEATQSLRLALVLHKQEGLFLWCARGDCSILTVVDANTAALQGDFVSCNSSLAGANKRPVCIWCRA